MATAVAVTALAYDFDQAGLYFNYNSYTGEATLTYRDTDFNSYAGVIVIPSQVFHDGQLRDVTAIDFAAFYNCYLLQSVTIPSTVRTIGQNAFYNCISLPEVTIPGSVTEVGQGAFSGCTALARVTLSAGATNLAFSTDVFNGCGIKHVRIDRDITNSPFAGIATIEDAVIGAGTSSLCTRLFNGCSGLTDFTIEDTSTELSVSDYTLSGTNVQTAYVGRDLSSTPFYESSTLKTVTVGDMATNIGQYAFFHCTALESVTIGNGVTVIDRYAFQSCNALTTLTLGNSLKSINYYAFMGCSSLQAVTIPASVTFIDSAGFGQTAALVNATFEDGTEPISINDGAFSDTGIKSLYIGRDITGGPFSGKTTIESVTFGNKVTYIGGYTFNGCRGLTEAHFGNALDSIAEGAFQNCSNLKEALLPDGLRVMGKYAFYGCSGLESVALGTNIQAIPYYAFQGCISLQAVTIPASVTFIDGSAFGNTTALTEVTIADGNQVIDMNFDTFWSSSIKRVYVGRNMTGGPFQGKASIESVTIGDNVTFVTRSAFSGCSGITTVQFGNALDSIANYAFYNCTSLKAVTLPNSLRTIGSYAFANDSAMTTLALGNNLQYIGDRAFNSCKRINNPLTIPVSVKEIKDVAFAYTTSLTDMTIADSDEPISITAGAFDRGALANLYLGRTCPSSVFSLSTLRTVVVGDKVTYLSRGAFTGSGLTTVTLGESLDSIARAAFRSCASLPEIVIPDGVRVIEMNAFEGCSLMHKITLGESIERFGTDIFPNCSSVDTVVCRMQNPPVASTLSFPGSVTANAILMVPRGTAGLYSTIYQWRLFTHIEEYGEAPVVPGDLDGTGVIDGSDVSAMLEIVLSGGELTPEQLAAGDIDGSGTIDGSDVSAILEIVLSGE